MFVCVGVYVRVCVCKCSGCPVFTPAPSWQGKMDGLCYRFLADKSPYNHLISYYQPPRTLKLIFIGVKREIPTAWSTFMVLTFHWWMFSTRERRRMRVLGALKPVETLWNTPASLIERNFWCSKHVQGDGLKLYLDRNGMSFVFFPRSLFSFSFESRRNLDAAAAPAASS